MYVYFKPLKSGEVTGSHSPVVPFYSQCFIICPLYNAALSWVLAQKLFGPLDLLEAKFLCI